MPLPIWLPVWLTNLLGGGWIRGLLGIRKDLIDTKKSKLEVKRLEDEERVRHSLITPATMADVERYDPNVHSLLNRNRRFFSLEDYIPETKRERRIRKLKKLLKSFWLWAAIIIVLLLTAVYFYLR